MKRSFFLVMILFLGFLFQGSVTMAETKTCVVSCDWDGKDATGALEGSLPAVIKIYDASTDALKTQAEVNGPVSAFALPGFPVEVADNVKNTFTFYGTVTDSAGNVSAPSVVITKIIVGKDTVPPSKPSLIQMIISFIMRLLRIA